MESRFLISGENLTNWQTKFNKGGGEPNFQKRMDWNWFALAF